MFKSAIAILIPDESIEVVIGETLGQIVNSIRGTGWGFDPIFSPNEMNEKTYGEMTPLEKNSISHRRKALDRLREILQGKT